MRICLKILHIDIIHDTDIPATQRFGHSKWYLGLGFYNARAHLYDASLHFLLLCYSHRTTFFRLRLRNPFVSLSLLCLQEGTDIFTYIHISNINRQNLERCTRIKTLGQHCTRDQIRILQYILVRVRGTICTYNPFPNTSNNGLFTRTTDETINIRAHGNTSSYLNLDTILGNCGDNRRLDNTWVNTHLDSL
ncbi:hypothetical protein D1872_257430 [compost metagenome]